MSVMTTSCVNSVSFFEDDDKKYKICCCHIRKAAKVTGAIDLAQAFLIALVVFAIIKRDTRTDGENPTVGATMAALGIVIFCSILFVLLYRGIDHDKPVLLLPYLVIYWLWIGVVCVAIFLYVALHICYGYVWVSDSKDWDMSKIRTIRYTIRESKSFDDKKRIWLCLLTLWLVIRTWLQTLVHRCHGFLKEKQRNTFTTYIASHPAVVQVVPAETLIHASCPSAPQPEPQQPPIYGIENYGSAYMPKDFDAPPPYQAVDKNVFI